MHVKLLVTATVLLTLTVAGCSPVSRSARTFASHENCEVYQAFAKTLAPGGLAYVRSATIKFEHKIEGLNLSSNMDAPRKFRGWRPEPTDQQSDQDFDLDTSSFFGPLASNGTEDISACLQDQSFTRIFDGPYELYAVMSVFDALFGYNLSQPPALLNFSKAAISSNHRFALVYYEQECRGWCGIGVLLLFERRDQQWVPFGEQVTWIS